MFIADGVFDAKNWFWKRMKINPYPLNTRSEFPLKDLIYGPLEVISKKKDSRTYTVPKYQEVVSQFDAVKGLDLTDI